MSQEQIEEDKEAFRFFDKDGDGKISIDGLRAVLGSMGKKLSQAELEDVFREVDNDGNGLIDFEEFLEMITSRINYIDIEEGLREAFHVLDKDGNCFITASYLRQVMTIIGDKLTDERIDEIIREIVIDGDVMVNHKDFLAMMTQE